jgi:hypothetical protein
VLVIVACFRGINRTILRDYSYRNDCSYNHTYVTIINSPDIFLGKRPLPSRGSHVELKLSSHSSYGESKWNLNTESIDGASVTFSVDTPPTCPVGKWHVKIDVQQHGGNSSSNMLRFGYRYPIYILFNPWCEGKWHVGI